MTRKQNPSNEFLFFFFSLRLLCLSSLTLTAFDMPNNRDQKGNYDKINFIDILLALKWQIVVHTNL